MQHADTRDKNKMLTHGGYATLEKEEKTKQLTSDLAVLPFVMMLVLGTWFLQPVMPWNGAVVGSLGLVSSGNLQMNYNQTHTAVYEQWRSEPSGVDNEDSKDSKPIGQKYHPIVQIEEKNRNANGAYSVVLERADWRECDLPSCHLRFMIQEQARDSGIFYIGMGVAALFSLIMKTHYAARATAGLHTFAFFFLFINAYVFAKQAFWPDSSDSYAPHIYRTTSAKVFALILALVFVLFGALNLLAALQGEQKEKEITEQKRKEDATGRTSGLKAGPSGSVEWKSFTGKEKGVQVASGAGLCAVAVILAVPAFLYPTFYYGAHASAFRYGYVSLI